MGRIEEGGGARGEGGKWRRDVWRGDERGWRRDDQEGKMEKG